MLASEIIDEAREFHISFDELAHPTTMLLRALSRAEMRFSNVVSNMAMNAISVDLIYDEDAIAAGILGGPLTIPAYRTLMAVGIAVMETGIYPVNITEDEESRGGGFHPIRLVGRALYIAQPTGFQAEMPSEITTELNEYSNWKDVTALRITYVPAPVNLTALDDILVTPDDARMFLQAELVKFMANRGGRGVGREEKTGLMADASMLQEEVLDFYAKRAGGETRWYVSTVG